MVAAGHSSYTMAHRSQSLDLFIADPANVSLCFVLSCRPSNARQYALLFSGESVARSPHSALHTGKQTIWALFDRAFLLWHGCTKMRNDKKIAEMDKAHFAVKAWLEADALEHALNKHTCAIERSFIFQAREYIFKYALQPVCRALSNELLKHPNVHFVRVQALHSPCLWVSTLSASGSPNSRIV